jgi:DNA-binding NarL/FixJ family response regulator
MMSGAYSAQPAWRRIYRRYRDARIKAQLHAIRATTRGKEPITSGSCSAVHRGFWSAADEVHVLRLHALGFDVDHIAPVIQRSPESVRQHLRLLRKGRRHQKSMLRDRLGRFCRAAEARP